MDPKQQGNQSNRSSRNDFVIPEQSSAPQQAPQTQPQASDKAADIIRARLNEIYGDDTPSQAPRKDTAHFNPFNAPNKQPLQPLPQAPPAPSPQAATPQQPPSQQAVSQQPTQPTPLHYNPYHKNDTDQSQQPGAAPGANNYRKNYSNFALPGTSETPVAVPVNPQQSQVVQTPAPVPSVSPIAPHDPTAVAAVSGNLSNTPSIGDLKDAVVQKVQKANTKKNRTKWKPLIVSLMVGLIFLGANYNEVAVAQVKQYISPGDAINTPVIIDPTESKNVSKDPRIIIPKINIDVPVVYDVASYEENAIQDGLERGVVHYGTTSLPGEVGNNVILGHSSNNAFNSGGYKFAFVLLFRLEVDDTFMLNYEGTRYVYRVYEKSVVEPDDFSVIQPTNKPTVTLITCTPPGTSWKRLVIKAEQISPNPNDATATKTTAPIDAIQLPSNAPSLWDSIRNSIF